MDPPSPQLYTIDDFLWLKGYFEDSSSPRKEKEADHPDILDLLEESS